MRTLVKDLHQYVENVVTLSLCVISIRNQKKIIFIQAKDLSGNIQLLCFKDIYSEQALILETLTVGSYITVAGIVTKSEQSKTNGLELRIQTVVIDSVAEVMPISEETSIDKRFDLRVVDLKSESGQHMLQARSDFLRYSREFLYSQFFTEIQSPKLMAGASESGSEVFKVAYFETFAYLAQSPQFYKQMAIATGLERVFEIGPIFRAERSYSSRHLTEFTGLDIELAWVSNLDELMLLEQELLSYALSHMGYADFKFERISLFDAKQLLLKHGVHLSESDDLRDEDERLLFEIMKTDFIFVYNYPIQKRPFYHYYLNDIGATASFDLLFKGLEITTGALREHRIDVLTAQALGKGLTPSELTHYFDNFRYGCPPHGGFGLGVERVIQKLLNLSSVKEASFVPRDPHRLTP